MSKLFMSLSQLKTRHLEFSIPPCTLNAISFAPIFRSPVLSQKKRKNPHLAREITRDDKKNGGSLVITALHERETCSLLFIIIHHGDLLEGEPQDHMLNAERGVTQTADAGESKKNTSFFRHKKMITRHGRSALSCYLIMPDFFLLENSCLAQARNKKDQIWERTWGKELGGNLLQSFASGPAGLLVARNVFRKLTTPSKNEN